MSKSEKVIGDTIDHINTIEQLATTAIEILIAKCFVVTYLWFHVVVFGLVYIALANGWLFLATIAGWTLLMSASVNGRAYLMVFIASITYLFHRKPVTFTQYLIGFLKKKTK